MAAETGRVRVRESIEASWKDLIFAFRSLLKSPTFTIVCVLSLAVGIGSNVGLFLLFRTLWAVPDQVASSDLLELVATPLTTERAALMGGPSDAPDGFRGHRTGEARTREFGVRMAIGASRPRVLREVSRDAVKLVLPGLLGGTLLVWAFLRVKSDIPRISLPMTLAAFGVAALTSIAIAVIASLGPAYRAASVQPAEAMRPD